jgi:hypothetical protein
MFWCEKQQRLGISTKESLLCFWDIADDFNFMLSFSPAFCQISTEQTMISFVHMLDTWITTDGRSIYLWDIKLERVQNKLHSEELQGGIQNIIEMEYLCVVMISTQLIITLWDFHELRMLYKLKTDHNMLNKVLPLIDTR